MEKGKASDARFTPAAESTASGSATESDLRTQIAHLTEEREGLKVVANRAGWHVEDMSLTGWIAYLAEAAHRLREEREGLRAKFDALAQWSRDEIAALTAAHERALKALEWVEAYYGHALVAEGCPCEDDYKCPLHAGLTSPEGPPDDGPWDLDPTCPTCKGSGEASNAQFKCACRWRRRPASPEGPLREKGQE